MCLETLVTRNERFYFELIRLVIKKKKMFEQIEPIVEKCFNILADLTFIAIILLISPNVSSQQV